MKKLLILMLVLVMASAASAVTVSLTVGGSSTVACALGTTHTVDMSVDQAAKGCANIDYLADTGISPTLGAWITALTATSSPGTIIGNDIMDAYGNSAGGVADQSADTILYSFDVTVNAYGDVTPYMDPMADAFFTDVSPGFFQAGTFAAVTFVPEPMTIVLLGLGGLFLRRRK